MEKEKIIKQKVVEAVADLWLCHLVASVDNFLIGDGSVVRFFIQSTGGGVRRGRKLFFYDHRPSIVSEAKALTPREVMEKPRLAAITASRQPARVVVMAKRLLIQEANEEPNEEEEDPEPEEDSSYYYVNLFPVKPEERTTASLFDNSYVGKHNAGFFIARNNALWSWESYSSSRTGRHWEMVLVQLSDEDHFVEVVSYGYANRKHWEWK